MWVEKNRINRLNSTKKIKNYTAYAAPFRVEMSKYFWIIQYVQEILKTEAKCAGSEPLFYGYRTLICLKYEIYKSN